MELGRSAVEFRVLGPVEIWVGDQPLEVGPPQQRLLLAVLAVDVGRPVSAESLIDRVWDDAPEGARRTLHVLLARLRRILERLEGPERATAGSRAPGLARRSGGYLLQIDPDTVDVHRAERLAREASQPGRGAVERAALLREALDRFRGEPLSGLPGRWAARTRQVWQDQQVATAVAWAQAELDKGDPGAVPVPLTALADAHPFMESLAAALMRALYAAGRPAEALARYAKIRRRLAEELGADPGPELQSLNQAVLRGELDPPAAVATIRPAAALVAPAQLPADVHGFVGRGEQLARMDTLLGTATGRPAVVIMAVSGTAGVGKTALAVRWAHQVADRFPDGQLYVNLRGFDPGGWPKGTAEAVRGFLDALGMPPERIPPTPDAQVGLYRSLLAGRRVLVVLDNARDAEQVRPLLPGTPTALAVVTSRDQLLPLVATDGAHPFALDVLPAAEAVEMLARRLGAARVGAEPAAAAQIVTACARLPLALAVAAARAQQTGFPLTALATELSEVAQRLDLLDAGDPASQVRAVLSWSYAALPPPAARLFRLLGLHAGPDISAAAAASLAGLPRHRTRQLLAELTRASLLTEHRPGRYTFHDLLRAYATDLTHRHDPNQDRREALARLIDHHTHTAHAATLLLGAYRAPITLPLAPPAPGTDPEHPANPREAMAWLTAEHPLLLATLQQAAEAGFDTQAWQLAWSLHTFLDRAGHWSDLAKAWQAALAAAHRLDNPSAQALAHRDLARAHLRLGRYTEAEDHLHRALDVYTQAGDRVRQGHTHHNISYLWERQGRLDRALHHAQQALALHQDTGEHRGEAFALNAVGWHHALLGDHTQALTYCEAALLLLQRLGERAGEANTWDSLGYIHHHLAHHTQAVNCYQHALDLLRELGDRYEEAATLIRLGDTHHAAGDADAARRCWQQAAAILDELDHPDAADARARFRTPAPISNGQAPQPTPG
jgi:DNA-binding SARP family transcriptional activator/tetratricopeptide (TPR) repeat protein